MDRKSGAKTAPSRDVKGKPQQYQDEDALSMHTTRDDYDYEETADLLPPSYSETATGEFSPSDPPPADEYEVITPPKSATNGWRINKFANKSCPQYTVGSETTVRMDERLSNPTQLYDYVNDYLRVVQPRPAVRIQGWHWETRRKNSKNEQERVYDFDVLLSLQAFIPKASSREQENEWWVPSAVENGDKVHRGSWRKTRAKGFSQDIEVGSDRKPELLDWCEDFCANKSPLKIFRVSRDVTGLDTMYLRHQVETLVRQTHYSGHVDITFPTADKNVDIYTPHWINKARISWVRLVFYLTFLWIISWPILLFTTKRWSVYNVEWRFSRVAQGRDGLWAKVYATISEEEWVKRHANLIKVLVLDKFHGDGTGFPLDDSVQRREVASGSSSSGNANVDAAVSFLHSGVSAWNSLHGVQGRGGGGHAWGADS